MDNNLSDVGTEAARPDLSGMIDRLLENPDIIKNVAAALGASVDASPKTDGEKDAVPASAEAGDLGEKLPEIMNILSKKIGNGGQGSKKNDSRSCLLTALKPYLSKERCEVIDYMLSLGRISELLGSLK